MKVVGHTAPLVVFKLHMYIVCGSMINPSELHVKCWSQWSRNHVAQCFTLMILKHCRSFYLYNYWITGHLATCICSSGSQRAGQTTRINSAPTCFNRFPVIVSYCYSHLLIYPGGKVRANTLNCAVFRRYFGGIPRQSRIVFSCVFAFSRPNIV